MTNNLRHEESVKKGSNRLLLALAVSFSLLLAMNYLEEKAVTQEEITKAKQVNPLTPHKGELFADKTPKILVHKPIEFSNDKINVELDLTGGKISKLELKEFKKVKDKENLVQVFRTKEVSATEENNKSFVEGIQSKIHASEDITNKTGLLFDAGWLANKFTAPDASSIWEVAGKAENTVMLKHSTPELSFYRTFKFNNDNFITTVEDRVVNNSAETIKIAHYSQIHHIGEREKGALTNSFTNYAGPEALIDGEKIQADYSDLKKGDEFSAKGKNVWAGVTDQYFASAIIPSPENKNSVKFKFTEFGDENYYTALVRSDVKEVAAGDELTETISLYAGPKSTHVLEQQGVDKNIQLPSMLDYGWFHFIAKLFFDAIMFINQYIPNLAICIIVLTILIKMIMYPLAKKSYVSMARLREIQPEMKALQEKYKDDRQTLGLETMKMYQKHKANPASGCLPVLVQIPIFFAMYKVILMSFEFRQADFLWLTDLSIMDPYFILPILMGISMYIQQKLNPPAMDETQQMVMNTLPFAFTVLFLFFPSGLVLYWLTNNVLTIVQQYYVMNKHSKQS